MSPPPSRPRLPVRKPTPAPARRRYRRFAVELEALLTVGSSQLSVVTADIGHGGLRVLTDDQLPLRQLVKVQLALPPTGELCELHGRLAHRPPMIDRDPRVANGVAFYGLGHDVAMRWAHFIHYVAERYPESEARLVLRDPAERIQAAFRRSDDQAYTLRIEVRTVADLVRMKDRELAQRRSFVLTREVGFVGDRVSFWIVHPVSGQLFELAARVSRVVEDSGLRGAELELLECDEARLRRFDEFIYDGMAEMFDDEEVLVDS